MLTSSTYKSKHFWWLVLKLLILMLFGYFIYHTLMSNSELNFHDFSQVLKDSSIFSPLILLSLLTFTLLNWSVEIIKWKILTNTIQRTSWKETLQQSLASLTFSLITPNRIGEYGVKALYFQKEQRKKVVVLNFIGNFHQLVVTLILGTIGVVLLRFEFASLLPKNFKVVLYVVSSLVGITAFILFFSKRLLKWRKKQWKQLDFITKKLNFYIFNLSLLRYLIFSHQFYFLLLLFDVSISYGTALQIITSMYLIASIIPMLSLFDFVLKGSVAVTLFSLLNVSPLIVLTITTLMWLFNFVLPALLGSYYVLTFKPVKS